MDIIVTSIAAVIVPPKEPIPIDTAALEKVLTRPIIGQRATGLIISSQRDQIEAIISGNKINIRDLSGRQDFSSSKIPSTLIYFADMASSDIVSYGVNFVVSVPCQEAGRWVADNIISSKVSEKTGKSLIRGAAAFSISTSPKTLNIKLEPSENVINVDFNSDEAIKKLPTDERMHEELKEQFETLSVLLNKLGLTNGK